jgi:alkylation response protein AidB-like acyl-CoA dehydrogenase
MAIGIFVGESMGYRTTGLIDERFGATSGEDAHVAAIEEFAVEASIIKVYGSEVLDYCADECVQIHGGYGFIEEYAAERLLRDSRINRIFEGTNEINRLIVPATILKRAMKGQSPLIERAAFVRAALAKGEAPRAGDGEFGVVTQVVDFCKWIATYVLAVAAETYHVHIADEQEILGELADIVSQVYALDTAVSRVKQIVLEGKNEMSKAVARDLLTAFAPPAYSFCVHTARHVLMDVCDPASLPQHLDAIGKLRIDWPSKVIAAKRRIARAVLEADGYPIPREC